MLLNPLHAEAFVSGPGPNNVRSALKPHKEPTLEGHELVIFVVLYIIAVVAIVILFEMTMPVLFNPNYPEFRPDT
ncbi:hypothetical protein Tcan_18499 [Toxocara canis]|uniref:Uncharacterized protein n=1 Tax=Toxocara canis TaxID=6265 RepID=A0A0B2W250_TOXCA|nr:hypothetical protein Tcan_18499 [Toxocara canis]